MAEDVSVAVLLLALAVIMGFSGYVFYRLLRGRRRRPARRRPSVE